MSATRDITITSGDTIDIVVPIRDENGDPATLSSPQIVWMLATKPEPAQAEIKVTKSSGVVGGATIAEVDGVWTGTITLEAVDTETLTPGRYFHAARIVDGGFTWTVVKGVALIEGSIPIP